MNGWGDDEDEWLPSDVAFLLWLESLDPVVVERDRESGAVALEQRWIRGRRTTVVTIPPERET